MEDPYSLAPCRLQGAATAGTGCTTPRRSPGSSSCAPWVTPSGIGGLPHFEFIHKVIGADRIIWSVDYPYLTLNGTREFIESLPVGDDDRER